MLEAQRKNGTGCNSLRDRNNCRHARLAKPDTSITVIDRWLAGDLETVSTKILILNVFRKVGKAQSYSKSSMSTVAYTYTSWDNAGAPWGPFHCDGRLHPCQTSDRHSSLEPFQVQQLLLGQIPFFTNLQSRIQGIRLDSTIHIHRGLSWASLKINREKDDMRRLWEWQGWP